MMDATIASASIMHRMIAPSAQCTVEGMKRLQTCDFIYRNSGVKYRSAYIRSVILASLPWERKPKLQNLQFILVLV